MRRAGVLIHPSSLPGPGPIGDLATARGFVLWLAEQGLSSWQILPTNPVGPGRSPYASPSAFAGEISLLSVADLVVDGLLPPQSPPPSTGRVDAALLRTWKRPLLNQAADALARREPEALHVFAQQQAWAADWALYAALAEVHGGGWWRWPEALRRRDPDALEQAWAQLSERIDRELALQLLFERQWGRLREVADQAGVEIIGDVPIFVSGDGADTWVHRAGFQMDADGRQPVRAGVPPDYFSPQGQLWGNPHYDWQVMARDGFGWWKARMARGLAQCHVLRVDHFRGFESAWAVPEHAETALEGRWVPGPGRALFDALGPLPLIAEDLGIITPQVQALRDGVGLPGMRVLQFAFGEDDAHGAGNHPFLPHQYVQNCVAYTGTHDNDTAMGWYRSAPPDVQHRFRVYVGRDGSDAAWDLIRLAWSSVAERAIAPMQDLLALGAEHRMNVPGQAEGNWGWRMDHWPSDSVGSRIKELTLAYGRHL